MAGSLVTAGRRTAASARGAVVAKPGPWLGWTPRLSVMMALGLAVIASANTLARADAAFADVLWWIGLLVIIVPVAARTAYGSSSRTESISLVLMLGIAFYLVKVLHSPTGFTFHDEFTHWRTTTDIIGTGRLFTENPLLPVSARYPGLELVTAMAVNVTGLSVFDAGLVVAAVARVVVVLSLYLLFESLARSRRIAGLATVIYMTNPNFLFFGGQFKYETLALAFGALSLYLVGSTLRRTVQDSGPVTVFIIAALFGVATTHHMTTYAVIAFLFLWVLVATVSRGREERTTTSLARLILPTSLAISVGWLIFVAPITVPYLAPVLIGALEEGFQLMGARLGLLTAPSDIGRELFVTTAGLLPGNAWERYVSVASVALILLGLAWGAWRILRIYRSRPFILALLAVSAFYPATLLFRLTQRGWEASNRSSEILFVGIGLVLAIGFVGLRPLSTRRSTRPLIAGLAAGVLVIGGIYAGWSYQWRLPWPYAVADGPRAVELQSLSAATWVLDTLGPGNRIAADQSNQLLLGSFGKQQIMSTISRGINPQWVIFSPTLDVDRIALLRQGRVRYLLIDRRLVSRVDLFREYFDEPEPFRALHKFDDLPGVSRIFDSGDIWIYDVGVLSGAR